LPDRRVQIWGLVNRDRAQMERANIPPIIRSLNNQVKEAIEHFKRTGKLSESDASLLIKEGDSFNMLHELWLKTGRKFAKATFEALNGKSLKDFNLDNFNEAVVTYIKIGAADKVSGITDTSKQKIINIINKGVVDGLGIEEIARTLDKEIKALNRIRARAIARTETIAASNFGSLQGAVLTGLELKKEWINTLDDRTRGTDPSDEFDHTEKIDSVPKSQPFIVGGEELMFPGDSSLGASAGNTINCRCTLAFKRI